MSSIYCNYFIDSISFNSSSEIIATPKVWALVSLLPASSPAKTYEVFFETDELVFPPFCSMSFEASLLVIVGSVPVRTKVKKRLHMS